MSAPGDWEELAGWFRAMSDGSLLRELEAVRNELARAGSYERPLISGQLEVLTEEMTRRGLPVGNAADAA